ncbi:MAG: cyclic nucleotide-binding domain-containing protein [Polyangia bacterium]
METSTPPPGEPPDELRRDRPERLGELADAVLGEPRSIPRRLELAAALLEVDRRDEAISLFRDVAMSYAEDGQIIQAMAVCRGILDLDPTHEETVVLLAGLVEKRGRHTVRASAPLADAEGPTVPPGFDGDDQEEVTEAGGDASWSPSPPDELEPSTDEQEKIDRDFLPTAPELDTMDDADDVEDPTSPGGELASDEAGDAIASALELSHAQLPEDLPAFPLFSDLPTAAFSELLRELTVLERPAGETIVVEGTPGDAFYLIAHGTVRVKKHGKELALLGAGSFFGEFAVLADQRRHATVESVTQVELLEVSRALVDRLIAEYPGVARTLRAFYADRLLSTMLETAPFFAGLNPEERAEVATRFRPRRFGRGATVIEEGTQGGGLYLILVGEVEIVRSDLVGTVELGRLGEGSYIGEMSLLKGTVASATVRATRLCETVHLPPRDFYEIVSRHPLLWDKLRAESERRELTNVAILAGEARSDDAGSVFLM